MMSRRLNSPISSSLASSGTATSVSLARSSLNRSLSRTESGENPTFLEKFRGRGIAFRVDPGAVERIIAAADLEKARGLSKGRRPDSLDLFQLLAVGERAVLLAIIDDAPGGELVEPRDVPQQGNAGRVDVDTDEIDATRYDRIERLLELFGVDVVLVNPTPIFWGSILTSSDSGS